jgi:hypothetical protein
MNTRLLRAVTLKGESHMARGKRNSISCPPSLVG